MSTSTVAEVSWWAPSFRHGALLYASRREFVDGTPDFIGAARAAGEPMLVVPKIALLKREMGPQSAQV